LIHEETGLLVRGYDPMDVAAALKRIIVDRSLAERLGKAGREHVTKTFPMRKMADRYLELFRENSAQEKIKPLLILQSIAAALLKKIEEFVRGGSGKNESDSQEGISQSV
jgi:hypothetical protein